MKTIPLSLGSVNSLPTTAGIYWVYCPRTNELLYIGQTQNFRSRFTVHFSKWRFRRPKVNVKLEPIANRIQRIETERAYILKHKPPLNRAISTRKYESRITICDPEALEKALAMRPPKGRSGFGPQGVAFYECPMNGNEEHFAATPLSRDGTVIVTNRRENAFVTNSAWEWHLLKFFFRSLPGSKGSHECSPHDYWKWGKWRSDSYDRELTLFVRRGWEPYAHTIPGIDRITREDFEHEASVLKTLDLEEHIPDMWKAAEVFLRQYNEGFVEVKA